jgi:hypothetical protein
VFPVDRAHADVPFESLLTSWSSTPTRDDRTHRNQLEQRSARPSRLVCIAVLATAIGLVVLGSAGPALADTQAPDTVSATTGTAASAAPQTTPPAASDTPSATPTDTTTTGADTAGDDPGTGTVADATTTSDATTLDPLASNTDSTAADPTAVQNGNSQAADAEATATQTDPSNGTLAVRVDDPGATGSVTQTNTATSTASSTADGNPAPAAGDQTATATATTNQTGPQNTNVTVLVDSPGDVGAVNQTNTATATAGAQANDGGTADATARQTSPGNVNVTVRVGSAGDNGDVSQANTTAATAGGGTSPAAAPTTPATAGPAGTDQTVTTSGSAAVANAGAVDQEIQQLAGVDTPPDSAAASPAATPPANARASGTANATQTGALNANVSIRVGSPGVDGAVTQVNGVTATGTTPAQSIVTVTPGTNAAVAVSFPTLPTLPTGTDWQWNWIWDGTWTQPTDGSDPNTASADGSIWNWIWSSVPGSSGAASSSATAGQTGLWTWNWTWALSDGSTYTWSSQQTCTCDWTWNWSWDWDTQTPASTPTPTASTPAAPATTPSDPAPFDPSTDSGPVVQTNSVSAEAAASVTFQSTQDVQQDVPTAEPNSDPNTDPTGDPTTGVDQRLANAQSAEADATATQIDPANGNTAWNVPVASVTQANLVAAEASALVSVEVDQAVGQQQQGADPATTDSAVDQWLGAGQAVTNAQTAEAAAEADQTSTLNANIVVAPSPNQAAIASIEQTNWGGVQADVRLDATIGQEIDQGQVAADSTSQEADASQVHANAQDATAGAIVGQTRTTNLDNVTVPAGSRATNPSVRQRNLVFTSATATDTSDVQAWIAQGQGGGADAQLSSADQQASVRQSALSYSPASQTGLLNYAEWAGIEPPADVPPPASPPDTTGTGTGDTPLPVATTPTTPVTQPAASAPYRLTTRIAAAPSHHRSGSNGRTPRRPHRHTSTGAIATPLAVGHARPARHSAPFLPPVAPVAPTAPAATSAATTTQVVQAATVTTPAPPTEAAAAAAVGRSGDTEHGGGNVPVNSERAIVLGGFQDPFALPGNAPSIGASGSAPPPPGGGVWAEPGRFKLAAPAPIGPRMPTSTPGWSTAFIEPFERPG